MDFDVGARLRAIRTERGLTQRQLAERGGVTNGMISMVEQNQTSPSVSSLKKILDGLGMTMAEFFAHDPEAVEPVFFSAAELTEIATPGEATNGKGPKVEFRQVGDAWRHSLQMLYERYEPGADTGQDLYAHEAEEAGIVVSGRIEITVGDRVQVLGPGDAYLFDSRQPHRFRNVGEEECVIISACTPPSF